MNGLDKISTEMSPDSLVLLRVALALIMYGIALDIKPSDFSYLFKNPKAVIIGFIGQMILLPAMTFCLISVVELQTSIALGLIVVASCPGGNMSNLFTVFAKGNVPLSIALTGLSTLTCLFLTPFNISFWSKLYLKTQDLPNPVSLNAFDIFTVFLFVIALPLILGMLTKNFFPKLTLRLKKTFKIFSVLFLVGFISIALAEKWTIFSQYIHEVLGIVVLHNTLAVCMGYTLGALFRLDPACRKTFAIELGIQNSGLGLILILDFFKGLGGMAMLAACWGIYDFFAGLWIVGLSRLLSKGKISCRPSPPQ